MLGARLPRFMSDNWLPPSSGHVPVENRSMWNYIASWPVVAIVGPGLVLLAFGVLSMSPPEVKVAQVCFGCGYLVILAKIAWWLAIERTEPLLQRSLFIALVFAAVGVLWFLSSSLAAAKTKPVQSPESLLNSDLKFIFYGKERLFCVYTNGTKYTAFKPSLAFGLGDATTPFMYPPSPGHAPIAQPFPIPIKVLSDDYARPGDFLQGPEILADFMGHIKNGDVIFGVAWLTCSNCVTRRAYYIYWKVAEGGWYAETDAKSLEGKRMTIYADTGQMKEYLDKEVPVNTRQIMQPTFVKPTS